MVLALPHNAVPVPPGSAFGALTTTGEWRRGRYGCVEWSCLCRCGAEVWRAGGQLRYGSGQLQSCGCLMRWGWGLWRFPNGNRAWWEQLLCRRGARARRWRRQRRLTCRLREHKVAGPGPTPEGALLAGEAATLVRAAVAQLPPRRAAVLVLRFGLGEGEPMTLRAAGAVLGCTYENVRVLEVKALKLLRRSRLLREICTRRGLGETPT